MKKFALLLLVITLAFVACFYVACQDGTPDANNSPENDEIEIGSGEEGEVPSDDEEIEGWTDFY